MTDDATDDGWICRSCGQWFLTWPADSEACPGPRKGAQEPTGTSRDLEGAQQPAGAAHELAAPHDAEPVHPVWGYGPAYEKLEPTHGDLNVTHTGRFLDPVRAAALHEAVQHEAHRMRPPPDDEAIGRVIAAAKMFEAWLEGPKRFDAYLAEDEAPVTDPRLDPTPRPASDVSDAFQWPARAPLPAEPCVHADRARLDMVEQLHTTLYGATWARPETPKQVWESLLGEVRRLRTGTLLADELRRIPVDPPEAP